MWELVVPCMAGHKCWVNITKISRFMLAMLNFPLFGTTLSQFYAPMNTHFNRKEYRKYCLRNYPWWKYKKYKIFCNSMHTFCPGQTQRDFRLIQRRPGLLCSGQRWVKEKCKFSKIYKIFGPILVKNHCFPIAKFDVSYMMIYLAMSFGL